MACGLAPVATAVGDACALVGDTGLIVPARQPAALAAAVKQLLDEPAASKRARREAARRRIVADYSLARMIQRFGELYSALARPPATGAAMVR
jgi:glycosyltransferase involved in cell wall biosynthesis